MPCLINNGVRQFPKGLSYILRDNYSATAPQKKKYLGGKTLLLDDANLEITVLLPSTLDTTLFLEWWITELNFGTEDFTINLPYFGITKDWLVVATNEIKENLKGGNHRSVVLKLKIKEDIETAINNNVTCQ